MRDLKLKLDLDALVVDSFDPEPRGARAGGTVFAHGTEPPPADSFDTDPFSCNCGGGGGTGPTCGATCPATCAGQNTCAQQTCGLTYCVDSCDYCLSFVTDAPQRC